MLSLDIDVRSTSNSPDVLRRLAKADKRFMHWYGGALRKTIRRSVRTGKKTSKPGKPPRRWAGDGGLRRVAYEVSRQGQSVIVGVVKYNAKQGSTGTPTPKLIEEGGNARRKFLFRINSTGRPRLLMYVPPGTAKRNVSLVFHRKAKSRSVRYKARPFVKPAFERMNKGIAERYARAVRRAL